MARTQQTKVLEQKRQAKQQVKAALPPKLANKQVDHLIAKTDKLVAFIDTRKSNKDHSRCKIGTVSTKLVGNHLV